MKKIIIATLAAMTGFSAIGSACAPAPTPDTAWVYKWQFKGKTTTGKALKTVSSACGPTTSECAYRVPASLKIQGYTYACSPQSCIDGSLGFETIFAEANEVFWMTKPYKSSFAGGVTFEVVNLIGKNKKKVEVGGLTKLSDEFNTDWNLNFAGLGKYKTSNGGHISSVSGNFAGYASKALYVNPKLCGAVTAGVWECDTMTLVCEERPTVCFGKWSVKFQRSASKKYLSGKAVKLPAWVKARNVE